VKKTKTAVVEITDDESYFGPEFRSGSANAKKGSKPNLSEKGILLHEIKKFILTYTDLTERDGFDALFESGQEEALETLVEVRTCNTEVIFEHNIPVFKVLIP
jgi:hypothetical protein